MKKVLSIILVCVMIGAIVGYSLLGVDFEDNSADVEILRVYNWEEYISESDANKIEWSDYLSGEYQLDEDDEYIDLIYLFESYCREELGRNVKVEYSTFGTNENMYNELNLSKKEVGGKVSYSYDLVCPSEYMLLKMMKEDMLEPLSDDENRSDIAVYDQNSSEYIRNLFKGLKIQTNAGEEKVLYDYATCYMWGTMGYVYNPELVDSEAAKHWSLLWDDRYKGDSTIKDSVRDSYILALGYVYEEELMDLREKYLNGELSATEYNNTLTEIYNRTDDESINKAGEVLTSLKDRLFGYEVDSGKKDMAQGKIKINFAWSGDAVYTMDFAEEDSEGEVLLEYAVPEEGSNIFFDGWAMPKGANKELARLFINFVSRPESACMNMNYIGYSSSIAGDVMFENAVDWYGTYVLVPCAETDEDAISLDGGYYQEVFMGDLDSETLENMRVLDNVYRLNLPVYDDDYNVIGISKDEEIEIFATDLSYFFNTVKEGEEGYKSYVMYTDQASRQCETQYPGYEVITRCTVMKCFTDDEIRSLNNMWDSAKVGDASLTNLLIVIGVVILVIVIFAVLSILYRKDIIKRTKTHKNLTLVSTQKDDRKV